MMKSFRVGIACLAMLALSACGSLTAVSDAASEHSAGSKIAVQYATLKVIEGSSDVRASDIVAHVERVRERVSGEQSLALDRLKEEALAAIDFDALDVSDRLLLISLLDVIEASVSDVAMPSSPLSDEQRVRILTLLDWVESAASLAG